MSQDFSAPENAASPSGSKAPPVAPPGVSGAFRFDAFLSYRRADGGRVANWLRKWMRSYRLPKSVRSHLPSTHTLREPLSIFLDTEYSRAVPDYYERNILPSLQQAEHLLVIASPQAMSPGADGGKNWVEREIGDFLTTSQRENIIAVATPEFARDASLVQQMPGALLSHFPRLQIVVLRTFSYWRFVWWPWTWHLRDAALTCVATLHHIPSELMPLLRQEEERLRRKRLGWVAAGACALLLLVTVLGGWALVANEQKLDALQDVLRISDIRKLSELNERAEMQLWPMHPVRSEAITSWLQEAQTLADRLPEHEGTLAALNQRKGLNETERGWWRANLEELTRGLQILEGIVRPNVMSIARVKQRGERIEWLQKVTIIDAASNWEKARAAIVAHPAYHKLDLPPQFGLVPLEPDPQTQLWEFWHPLSGERPQRDPVTGRWIITSATGIVMVLLPGGEFRMGASTDEGGQPNEQPVHDVEIAPYFLSKYEMTQAQWARFTNLNPSYFRAGAVADRRPVSDTNPVENVDWDECALTVWQMNLRLPTEAQWEYAARAGTSTTYSTGNDAKTLEGYVNIMDLAAKNGGEIQTHARGEIWLNDGHGIHAPVGAYLPNQFGLHDMHGNVMEWCWDLAGLYTRNTLPGTGERATPPSSVRVVRGGSFASEAVDVRSARRWDSQPNAHTNYLGVRPAFAIAQPRSQPPTLDEAFDTKRRAAWQHFDQGRSLGEKRLYAESIIEFEAAVSLMPNFLDARMNRGVSLVLSNRRSEALAEFEAIVKLEPKHAYARAKLAQGLVEAGRTAEAIPHYRQAFKDLSKPYPELTRLLMEALEKENRLPEAIEAAETHLSKAAPDAGFCYRYGLVLRKSGRLTDAIAQFEKSIALEPSAWRHAALGGTYALFQQPDAARRHYQAAVALAPLDEEIHNEFLSLLTKQNDAPGIRDEKTRWQQRQTSLTPPSP